MAEELKNTELTNTTSGVTSQGLVGNVSNTLEKIRKFSKSSAQVGLNWYRSGC